MKHPNRFLIFFVAVVMIITALPLSAAAEAEKADDIILFGSYPQSEVKDSALLSALNDISLNWESYDYYCGTGKWYDGQMRPSDYMRYADVSYGGEKYRAVTFDTFRPYFSGLESTAQDNSYQNNNGYECGEVYWFKFEPLKWRIVDADSGYAICESIIDSQPLQNKIFYNGWEYFADYQYYDFSNYYVVSNVRNMLNTSFYNCAFTDEEKSNLKTHYMDDLWIDIEDRVFLPSANEMKNKDYWQDDSSRIAVGTDYAKCQGLFVDGGSSYWYLRSPADNSYTEVCVSTDGTLYSYDYYYNRYSFFTAFTGTGIRPAIKIKDINSATVSFSPDAPVQHAAPKENGLSVCQKIKCFFKNIFGIVGYYLEPSCEKNEKALNVIENIGRGINMPCMESGWARDYILEKETFENVKGKGFDFIRLPANLACLLDYDGTLNESAMNGLDTVLNYALDSGLTVLLDFHGWEDLNNNPSPENIRKLVSVWEQVAKRYKDYPENLAFEIYNEPNNNSGKMTDAKWNYIQLSAVSAIRKIDADRIIALSPMSYNSTGKLSKMAFKRADKYVIADVHNYSPMEFTHQGAEWIPGVFEEKVAYSDYVSNEFKAPLQAAAEFQQKKGIKVVVGEFGAYLRQTDRKDVSAFLSDAVDAMKDCGLAWSYWEYNAGFGAYDYASKEWKPFVADALLKE